MMDDFFPLFSYQAGTWVGHGKDRAVKVAPYVVFVVL